MRNLHELDGDVDSMKNEILSQRANHYAGKTTFFSFYGKKDPNVLPPEIVRFKAHRDSISLARNREAENKRPAVVNPQPPAVQQSATQPKTSPLTDISLHRKLPFKPRSKRGPVTTNIAKTVGPSVSTKSQHPETKTETPAVAKPPVVLSADSLQKLAILKIKRDSIGRRTLDSIAVRKPMKDELQAAANTARQVKSQLLNTNTAIDNAVTELRIFEIQWHMILANSLACIAMFLIGAPLGAIIKKGGLGVPFLVSILFFIVYYVMNIIGQKWAKQGSVSIAAGVWAPDLILFVIGLLFLRQARADARLFDTDFYMVAFDKAKRWIKQRRSLATSTR
jgi:lipopolysaccharide export system permease protein